jgi:aerobic carbon-monoxide dehydrogenase small subunit
LEIPVNEQVVPIILHVNGRKHSIEIDPDERLIDTLRTRLGLTGVKEGCGEGECGACTVLMDGSAVNSCLVLTYQARGREILTIEGLSTEGRPDSLQEAFVKHHAIQCGYCTPGMILSAKGLLLRNPFPSEPEVKEAIAGNLCRCTGYVNIVAAVRDAARDRKGKS